MISHNSRNPHRLRIEARDPNWHQGHGPNRDPQADRQAVLWVLAIFGPWAAIGALLYWWLS